MFKQMSYSLAGLLAAMVGLFGMPQVAASSAPAAGMVQHAAAVTPPQAFADAATKRLQNNWPWYITRASGMLAALLLLLLVLSGVGLLTGYTYKLLEPLPAWAAHRALGLSFGATVLLHISSLLFDKFIGFTLGDLLVPFLSAYKPLTIGGVHLGSLYVACGVFSIYLVLAVIVSSLLWVNTKPRPWRALHYLSYAILGLVFVHSLFLGTDLKSGWFRTFWFVGAFAVAVSIVMRLWRAHTISKNIR